MHAKREWRAAVADSFVTTRGQDSSPGGADVQTALFAGAEPALQSAST